VKNFCLAFSLLFLSLNAFAQLSPYTPASETKKEQRRKKLNALLKQAEEGVLVYNKQTTYGLQARSNGYGLFYEMGRMKTPLKSATYRIDFTEIKHPKENKFQNISNPFLVFSNPYVYGKVNNFYQLTMGYGQQRILGQKGNKNGVSVSALYNGGLALGLLKPYYVQVEDPVSTQLKFIKYSAADSAIFLGPSIIGSGGFWRGWKEVKLQPGLFVKTALRFDYGRFNEVVSALELGLSAEYYTKKVTIMALQKDKPFFFQGYISILFGRRK
jgi:ribosomal protein S24E